jgi:hypothetical protein
MPHYQTRRNKVGIPAEVRTCTVPAFYYSDGTWVATTTTVKLIKNR